MYIPAHHRMDDLNEILSFMKAYNFAIVVSVQNGLPIATHIPITITTQDDKIILRAHFAKANSQWKSLTEGETLIIFSGPHAYISTSHYDKLDSVPTWNYITVHAYGHAKLVHYADDPQAMMHLIEEVIQATEPAYMTQWHGLSDKYRQGMMNGTVGFEMVVKRLDAKAKLSQNKHPHEQEKIIHTLLKHEDDSAVAVGEAMQKHLM